MYIYTCMYMTIYSGTPSIRTPLSYRDLLPQTFADLVAFTPTHAQCAQLLEEIERAAPYLAREPLSVKELSQFREKYRDHTLSVGVAKDDPAEQDKALEGPYRRMAPYPDPYDQEDPIHSYLPHDVPGQCFNQDVLI